jgi:uncharacterized coiled-coil DUF342 family protein
MNQEVQIILTMEVDTSKSKKDIQDFFNDMEQTYTRTVSMKNRMEFLKIEVSEIKEEAEIYETEIMNSTKKSTDALQDLKDKISKLQAYYIGAEVDDFGEDANIVVDEMENGDWIDKHELAKVLLDKE